MRNLLMSIANQTTGEYETILVVENSEDMAELAKEEAIRACLPNTTIVNMVPGSGASSCRNAGARSASGDILGFVDDDVVLDPGWVESVLRAFKSMKFDALAGSAAPAWEDSGDSWLPKSMDWIISCTGWYGNQDLESYNMWTMNSAIRKDVFLRLGGFNEALGPRGGREVGYKYLAEDLEFSLRLRRGGHKILYVPEMSCLHNVYHEQVSMRHIINRSIWVGRERRILREVGGDISRGRLPLASYLLHFLLPTGPKHYQAMAAILVSLMSLAIGYTWRHSSSHDMCTWR